MSTPSAPNPVKPPDIIEEACKTSWVSTAYPTAAYSKFNPMGYINPDIDVNHQVGRNFGDGSIRWTDFYNWNTWKEPVIEDFNAIQYDTESGVRLSWRAHSGDVFRTGYIIERSPNADMSSATVIDIVRFAPEFNPAESDLQLKYSLNGEKSVAVYNSQISGYLDVNKIGTHRTATDDIDPDAAAFYDTFADRNPDAVFSFYDDSASGSASGTTYYYRLTVVDGREAHTLDLGAGTYTTTTNSSVKGSYDDVGESYLNGVLLSVDPYNHFNANDGIVVFDTAGTYTASEINRQDAKIVPENAYPIYLGDQAVWIFVEEGDSTNDTFPPAGATWQKVSDVPILVTGLDVETQYSVWIEKYKETDDGEPSEMDGTGADIAFTTDPAVSEVPVILSFTWNRSENRFEMEWDDYNGVWADDFDCQYAGDGGSFVDGGSWSNKTNWATENNPKTGYFNPTENTQLYTTIEVQIRARGSGSVTNWSTSVNGEA